MRWGVPTGGPDFRGNMKDGMRGWDVAWAGLGSLLAIRLSNSLVRLELRRAIRRFCLMIETSVALELAHHM